MTTGKKTTGNDAPTRKERLLHYLWGLCAILIAFFLCLGLLSIVSIYMMPSSYPSKMDGWVYFAGGERHVGHDNVIGLCRMDDTCQEIYMGCGAVNCQCVNKTEAEINEFFTENRCAFVSGEGVVCQ